MLYSAKLKVELGECFRKSVNANNYKEAFNKAQEIVRNLPYKVNLIDVLFTGSKADKRGYYTEKELIS